MDWLGWYNALAKPAWAPAPATIGLGRRVRVVVGVDSPVSR
jgi:hypothetical protein